MMAVAMATDFSDAKDARIFSRRHKSSLRNVGLSDWIDGDSSAMASFV